MIGTMAGCQPIARKLFAKLDTCIVIVGGSAVVSMGGIFFNDLTGLPNLFGSIPVAAISIVLVLWGDKLVRASSMLISVIMIVGMILLLLVAVLHRSEQTVKIVSTFYLPEGDSLWTGVSGAIAPRPSNACNAPTYSRYPKRRRR